MNAPPPPTCVAVLTSGGDAPAMNAAVAGVVEEAARRRLRVLAVCGGFRGLAEGRIATVTVAEARGHVGRSGTWLESSRFPELRDAGSLDACGRALVRSGIEALVVIGGGGSLAGARRLAAAGAQVAFIPATIDNDIPGTALTIGMASAVDYGVGVVEQLRVTGRSLPGRAFLLQTLGGATGHLAAAIAARARVDALLVPERPLDLEGIAHRLAERAGAGEAIAVMSEGVGNAVDIAAELARRAGIRVHPTILGHAQRASIPSAFDRRLARAAGAAAVSLVARGESPFVAFSAAGEPAPRGLREPAGV